MMMSKQVPPGEVKPGWTTTEFWQTLIVHLIAAVIALGTVFHTNFNLNGLQAIVPAVAVIASAIAQSMYSHSRASVKSAAQAAGAQAKIADTVIPASRATGSEAAPIVVQLTGIHPPPSIGGDVPGGARQTSSSIARSVSKATASAGGVSVTGSNTNGRSRSGTTAPILAIKS